MSIISRKTFRGKTSREHQVETMRKRVRRDYKEHAYYWTVKTWEATLKAFNYQCVYCGKAETNYFGLTMDHYIPAMRGGKTRLGNIVPACRNCNSSKNYSLPWQWCGVQKHERIEAMLEALCKAQKVVKGGDVPCADYQRKKQQKRPKQLIELEPLRSKPELSRSKNGETKMALLTKQTGAANTDFEPCPEGDFQAVVCDVVDLGHIEKMFEGHSQGLKPHVQFVYQVVGTDEDNNPVVRDDGKPFLVFGRRLVLSTHERSGFYKEICGIMGKKKIDEALESGTLDTEDFVGQNVNITVTHTPSKDGTKVYANIEAMKPWNQKFGPNLQPTDYTRRSERPDYQPPAVSAFEQITGNAPAPQTQPVRNDPRLSNSNDTRKEYAKQLAAEANEADDEPDFFDENVTDEQRALMLEQFKKENSYGKI